MDSLKIINVSEHDPAEEGFRSKWEFPYSYDPVLVYLGKGKATDTIYTDRLLVWDFDKHDRICQEVFGNKGQYWDNRKPVDIEKFLQLWTNDPTVQLVSVTEYCNPYSGFPVWRLDYTSNKSPTPSVTK